jgi:ligand-binding sensor domain-containing protein/DNA-binding CsgD family transcriptional regulator
MKMMLKKTASLLLLLLIIASDAISEIKNIGTPFIRNFSKHDYRAGTQNWAISQDKKGYMYFANNDGLLVFDGVQWQLYEMPNSSMVRSIYIDDDGVVYVGAYNDFGKMVAMPNGKMVFKSLKDEINPEYRNFDDVWNILPYKGKIVFQSYNAAYIYEKDHSFTVIKAPSRFPNSFSVSGRLFFCDKEHGLYEFDGSDIVPLKGCEKLVGEDINSIMPFGEDNEILICTLNKGLFIYNGFELREWNVPVSDLIKRSQIFSATTLQDHYYAIGTIQDGLIIIDEQGELVQHINRKKGLQNNTILKVFSDRTGNLWLGLDNGIDYVNVNSPITFIQQTDGFGAGYTAIIFNGRLYLGTNQGLFVREWGETLANTDFRLIPETSGQVWYLGVHNGVLVCGHNNGTYIIDGEKARRINNIPGGWKYLNLKKYPGYMIGGTFSGIILFKWENNSWIFVRKIPGFNESFRVFEEDDHGDIWMSHGFKGIYRVRLSEDLDTVASYRFFSKADGLPSNYNLNVFKIKDKLIISSNNNGIYEYVPQKDRFIPSSYFNQLLNPLKSISYLKEDPQGNIWYISNQTIGVFRRQEDLSLKQVASPFTLLTGKFIDGFESVYYFSEEDIFIGVENGFAHYSPHAYYKSYPEFSAYITKGVAIYLDSTFYYGSNKSKSINDEDIEYAFPFKRNGFRFTFSSPVYDNQENIEYSYQMAGLSDTWSGWSTSYSQEFSHLPEGKYIFTVKARNQLGIESLSDTIKITILPPWYKSIVAYIVYLIIIISSIILLISGLKKHIEVANHRERLRQLKAYNEKEQEYKRQALLSEKEIISMKNERLQIEMIQRDKELANQAMNLVRKNEFLGKIRADLQNLRKTSRDESLNEKILSVISRINKDIDHNKQREVFERAFDEVHEEFLNRLKSKYPELTPTELRMCAYLKMNISTKEIAPLMNISVRGVEICRYRIRKKLGIDRSTNLTSLLIDL